MATEVIMPALGMAQDTGKVVRWLRREGDQVTKGEPLLEVETDKVTVEVEAPADGLLGAVQAGEGDDVPVGRSVALILAPGEEPAEPTGEPAGPPEPALAELAKGVEAAPDGDSRPASERIGSRRPLASPKARRLAAEQGLELATLMGSGPHGAVVAADVEALAGPPPSPAAGLAPVGAVWRRMAERTAQSWRTAPHFFLLRDVDASRLLSWRDVVRRGPEGESVTITDLLVKLAAEALRRHPGVNAAWADGAIRRSESINVGLAVAVEEGLVVPVVRSADSLSLADIAARRQELVSAARAGRLRLEDVSDGTFTVSNLGMFGVDGFLAVLNPPQAAILAVGRIAERVVSVGGSPVVRPILSISVSFDHRVVDGARGAEFLDTLASLAEEPAGLVK
jgi:pyruvate dehydrogenase E2 component (dihydrolipoamide acetyltransferase)